MLFVSPSYAQTSMDSENYKIEYGNINVTSGEKSSDNYGLTDTVGQFAPGAYSSNGYLVRAGFQYIYSVTPFYFSVSKTTIPFGTITPENPATDSLELSVSNANNGYQVTVIENSQLTNDQGAIIPDTSCDAQNCNQTTAAPWTLNSTYGFGYSMSGQDIPQTFINGTYFRPFPSVNQTESPVIVMSSSNATSQSQATLTFKITISQNQEAGNYQNIISFTAIPLY